MIDKIELRLPMSIDFTPEITKLIRDVDYLRNSAFMRRSRFYQGVGDLRPLGIDCLLHYGCKMGNGKGNHKLEMLDTGKKPYSALSAQVQAVVDGRSDELEIMRVDLCADIRGVPVSWFHPRVRIRYKRMSHQIGPLKSEVIAKAGIETISAGKRPNIVRIYDKVAESKMQFRKMLKKQSREADPLEFEKEFGFPEDSTLTRVERQFGGGRIPEPVSTFGKLVNAPDFNPFTVLEVVSSTGSRIPDVTQCESVTEYLAGKQLHQMVNEQGIQPVRRWLNKQSNGNGARLLKKYQRFLPGSNSDSVTIDRLFETYRQSVIQQLAN